MIEVPECFEGFAIPLGYVERYIPTHEDWSDWQHGKGDKLRVSQSNPHFRVVDGRLVPVK